MTATARLRSGEPVSALAEVLAETPAAAVLANCSMPEAMEAALAALKPLGLPFGAYANGFSEISSLPTPKAPARPTYCARHDLTPERYTAFALRWVEHGGHPVGGCCEVGPAHIRHLKPRALRRQGHCQPDRMIPDFDYRPPGRAAVTSCMRTPLILVVNKPSGLLSVPGKLEGRAGLPDHPPAGRPLGRADWCTGWIATPRA
jgi:hypothetical protein